MGRRRYEWQFNQHKPLPPNAGVNKKEELMEYKETGTCKHGEFPLIKGCPQCIAERRITGSLSQSTPGKVEKKILCFNEEGCHNLEGAYCAGDSPDCAFAEGNYTGYAPSTLGPTTADIPMIEVKLPIAETALTTSPSADAEVMSYYTEALKLQAYAESRVIVTAEDLKPATDDLSLIARLKKSLEEKRKEYVKPLQEHVKEINDAFKTFMDPIEQADTITRGKILAYQLKQKLIREEQEKINQLRLEAAQKEMALTGEITESVNLVEVIPEVSKRIRTELGIASTFRVRRWEIIDFSLVPDDLKTIDAGKVTKLVKAGIGFIAGIRIWEEDSLRVTPQ